MTAARTILPASALPLTVDVIDRETLSRQVAVSGSVVDAVSALLPAFSPTREKITGFGETLRGRSPLYAINGIPQTTPIRDGARDGYTIDPFFIDRVEVIYGSNALQGIGATGGVVNQVIVGAPKENGWSARTLLQGNSGDDFSGDSLGGKVAGLVSVRSGRFDATAGAAFERRGVFLDGRGRRIGLDGNQSEIQDTDSLSFFGRAGFDLSNTARIEVIANRFRLEGNNHYVPVDGNRALGIPATSRRGQTPGQPSTGLAEMVSASLADGDLAGGMRNLWDVHCLVAEFGTDGLAGRAAQHGLSHEVARALRLAAALYGEGARLTPADRLCLRRLTARDGWGRATRPFTRMAFYIRSHWLRMPPAMLARHLWTKWRKG